MIEPIDKLKPLEMVFPNHLKILSNIIMSSGIIESPLIVDEKTGELVAVAVAGLSKKITESINFGIKAGSVKNFLDSNQISTSLTSLDFSWGSSVDLSAILENATVYTFCK